eukprot:777213-Rhodomonas_salina.7
MVVPGASAVQGVGGLGTKEGMLSPTCLLCDPQYWPSVPAYAMLRPDSYCCAIRYRCMICGTELPYGAVDFARINTELASPTREEVEVMVDRVLSYEVAKRCPVLT